MTDLASAVYPLRVLHRRVGTVRHDFNYTIVSLLLDLDELPSLAKRLKLFSVNGWGPIAHRDRDHGPHDSGPLRPWVEAKLATAGVESDGGPIRLLAMPRVLGSAFNPLSVFYCHGRDERLRALIYEVHNTFGQHHSYVIPVAPGGGKTIAQSCDKDFYVSPFIPLRQRYSFRLKVPGERLVLSMRQGDESGPLLFAKVSGKRQPLSDATLGRVLLRQPVLTWKVLGAIHWEAFRLWSKGAVFQPRPKQPRPTGDREKANRPAIESEL
ncbi:MAG: DUF1365 domain-containing protein [Rhodospirillales bacterium]